MTNARVIASPRPDRRRILSSDMAEKSVGYWITSSRSTQLAGSVVGDSRRRSDAHRSVVAEIDQGERFNRV